MMISVVWTAGPDFDLLMDRMEDMQDPNGLHMHREHRLRFAPVLFVVPLSPDAQMFEL